MEKPVTMTEIEYQGLIYKDGTQMSVGPRHRSFYKLAREKYPEILKPMLNAGWSLFWREYKVETTITDQKGGD